MRKVIKYHQNKKELKRKAEGPLSKLMVNVIVEIIVVDGDTKAELNKENKR